VFVIIRGGGGTESGFETGFQHKVTSCVQFSCCYLQVINDTMNSVSNRKTMVTSKVWAHWKRLWARLQRWTKNKKGFPLCFLYDNIVKTIPIHT